MSAYQHLAQTYNILMSDVDYNKWAGYIHRLLGEKKSRIFEAACGTGNITCRLYDLGHDLVASDISEQMLDVAIAEARKKYRDIVFVQQDMRNICANGQFDAVISACDGLNYIDKNGVEAFGKSSFSILKKGGQLLFDISTRNKLAAMDCQVFFDDGDDTTCIWHNKFDRTQHVLTMDVTLFVRKGELFERMTEKHIQYAHDIKEIKAVMLNAGFESVSVYEAFSCEDYSENSDRVQFVCRKQ